MAMQPQNSTADLDPNIPDATDPTDDVAQGGDATAPDPIALSPDQAQMAGLMDCKPGDKYTVTLNITSNDDSGITASVEPDSAESAAEEAAEPEKPAMRMRSKVLSPTEAGFSSDGNDM